MPLKECIIGLAVIATASPLAATVQQPEQMPRAPQGTSNTLYCMRIEAVTGSRIEEVKCWTREQWAEQEVDVDEAWPKEGVRTIG